MMGAWWWWRLLEQRPQIRHQQVAQPDGGGHMRRHLRMQPGHIGGAVGLPGVHHHARVQAAGLHPAHEQLRAGCGAGETAHVVADVEHARQTHLQAGAHVPAHSVPAGGVVAGPGLRITLQPGRAAAGDEYTGSVLPPAWACWASKLARVISRPCSGRARCIGSVWPKPCSGRRRPSRRIRCCRSSRHRCRSPAPATSGCSATRPPPPDA
jgi:hypothetical protein